MHVLEIGTGTGYNAGLLAQLTGDPSSVTTVEIDEDLAARAENVLHSLVGPVRVLRGDGALEIYAQYDRVIATASAPGILCNWYTQLAPGGRLVMPLQGSLNASGLLVIEKDRDHESHGMGTFLPVPVSFMPLRSVSSSDEPTARELFQLPVKEHISVDEAGYPLIEALADPDFRWFLEWSWPEEGTLQMVRMTLRDGRRALVLKDLCQRTILQLTQEPSRNWLGQQHGEFPLWQRVCRFYREYQALGRPGKDAYRICLNKQQACLSVRSTEEQIVLRENLFAVSVTSMAAQST